MPEKEKNIERWLRIQVGLLGGEFLKWVSPGFRGVPDRICCMPGGKVYFVETKSTGKKLDPLQVFVVKLLRKLGFEVWVIDSSEKATLFIKKVKDDQVQAG